MPTANRRAFIPLALQALERQSYPFLELVVIDDGTDPVGDLVQGHPRVRYVRSPPMQLGAKRNLAVQHSRGAVICQWDDDDWSGSMRLTSQLSPLLDGHADIVGLTPRHILRLDDGGMFSPSKAEQLRSLGRVHPGTLLYWRFVWEIGAQYPPVQYSEDSSFLQATIAAGFRLHAIDGDGLWIYMLHGRNIYGSAIPSTWEPGAMPLGFNPATLSSYQRAARTLS